LFLQERDKERDLQSFVRQTAQLERRSQFWPNCWEKRENRNKYYNNHIYLFIIFLSTITNILIGTIGCPNLNTKNKIGRRKKQKQI